MKRRTQFTMGRQLGLPLGLAALLTLGSVGLAHRSSQDFPSMDEVLNGQDGGVAEDPEAKIRRLFGEVETKLKQVDVLLIDAAAGDTSALKDLEESGISKLLQASIESGRQAQASIREIIEIASSMPQSSSSSSSSQDQGGDPSSSESSDPNSPLNRGQQTQSPEATPEAPEQQSEGQEPGGQQPEPQGQQEDPSSPPQPEPGGQDPKNPQGDPNQDGQNRANGKDSDDATGSRANPEGQDGWGDLPTHVRDTFRSEGRAELPARYRDWIDEYYRKMNKRSPRR